MSGLVTEVWARAMLKASALRKQGFDVKVTSRWNGNYKVYYVDYYDKLPKRNPARKKLAPSVKTVSLKNFTGKLRINPGVPAGAVVVTGVGSKANISRKKSKKVAKFMVGSGVPAWKRKGKATLAKLRRNPAPAGFRSDSIGTSWKKSYKTLAAARNALDRLERQGWRGAVNSTPFGSGSGVSGKYWVYLRKDSFLD